ncbi:MAG: adenylyltransferase, partial [Ignavibacteriales bacterium]
VILVEPGETACLECVLDRNAYEPAEVPILGVSAGFIGIQLASMVIKYLTGCGEILAGQRLFWDFYLEQFISFPLERRTDCAICNRM